MCPASVTHWHVCLAICIDTEMQLGCLGAAECQNALLVPLGCAGDAYEYAALFSLKTKDEASMERSFAQLKSFYADTK